MLVYIEIIFFILILRNKLNDSKHTSSHIVYAATERKKKLFVSLYENVGVKTKSLNDLKENTYRKSKYIILKRI